MKDEITKLMRELGIPEQPRFVDRSPPRAPDMEQIRAFHAGTLTPELADEIEDLIALFREWHAAERQVLIERAAAFRERADAKASVETSSETTITTNQPPQGKKPSWSNRRLMKPVAVAAALLVAVTAFVVVAKFGGHRAIAELNDGSYHIALLDDGRLRGLPSVNAPLLDEVKSALTMKRVRVLGALPKLIGVRGALPPHSASPLVQPFQTVVADDRPLFVWKSPPEGTAFVVSVYDSDSKLVLHSEQLAEPKWTPAMPLTRGETYSWEVSATVRGEALVAPAAGEPRPSFRVMEADKLTQLRTAQREAAGCHLVLGVLYANEGLLDDAETEFAAVIDGNPNSQLAKELFNGVHRLRE